LEGELIKVEVRADNTASIMSIKTEVTSWRNRHYAMKAAWIRDVLNEEVIELNYQPGVTLVADALTKVLEKGKLDVARQRLHLSPGTML
jgi:hypothetical protein